MLFVSFILIVAYSQMRQFVQSSCIYYNQEGFSNEQSLANSQRMTSHQVDLENDIIIGIGFWISYRPLFFEILDQNPNTPQANDKKSFFVFSLTPQESEIFSLVFYIEISLIDETITHKSIVQFNDERQEVKNQPMDKDTYEGKWIFVYYLINRMEPSIIINYRYLQQEQISSEFYSGQLLLDSQMESTTGGYKDIYLIDMETLYLQTYPGKIQSVILKSYDFFFHNIQEFLTNCTPINCQNKEVTLIQYEYTQINKKEISLQVDSQIYTIQGWVKQDQLINQQESESLLFKISLNKNNIDNTKIDKSLFIIKYYQSLINLEQNGFSLQLYSYTFPWDTEPFFPIEQDSKYILGYKYMSLLTEWHYFQLQFGTLTNNYQPLFQIYYQVNDQMEYYTWNQNIMLFTVANMYFQIANDNYGLIQFKGQLKDWYLNQLCYPEIVEINFICHYTCKTCKGFSIQDCISCRGEHYRVFSESQNTCKCKLGYIDVPNQAQCQELNQYHKAFELQEKQIAIKKKGYYQTNQYNIICELGYFQYKNKCIECPYPIKNDRVQCADCIIYPNIFSQTLYCTFQFISKDDESVLIYTKLSENEQEIYTISDLIIENEYKIILIKGQGNLGCKNGYFKKNNICTQCSENCEKCKNEDYCDICLTQYKLNSENKCVECRICAKENILVTAYGTLAFYECEIGTYEYYQLCLPCGSYCSLCTQDSCYKCVDPEKYFITLDSINCILKIWQRENSFIYQATIIIFAYNACENIKAKEINCNIQYQIKFIFSENFQLKKFL